MEDKSIKNIAILFCVGVVLCVPIFLTEHCGTQGVIQVISKLMLSIGITIVLVSVLNIIYRILNAIFNTILVRNPYMNFIIFVILGVIGVVIWYSMKEWFGYGYFVLECISYVILCFCFLIDVNAVRCIDSINGIAKVMAIEIESHESCVNSYKQKMNDISVRKNEVLEELEPYIKKKLFRDSLKNLRKEVDITYVDNFLNRKPRPQGNFKGLDGLLNGNEYIADFNKSVNSYINKLHDDQNHMREEVQIFDSYVMEQEINVRNIKKSSANIEELEKLGFDTTVAKEINENDINEAQATKDKIRGFWKIHKKTNKVRRRDYGK